MLMVPLTGRFLVALTGRCGYGRPVNKAMVGLAISALVSIVGLAFSALGGYGGPGTIGPCSSFRQPRAPAPNSNAKLQPRPNPNEKAPTLMKRQLQLERKTVGY